MKRMRLVIVLGSFSWQVLYWRIVSIMGCLILLVQDWGHWCVAGWNLAAGSVRHIARTLHPFRQRRMNNGEQTTFSAPRILCSLMGYAMPLALAHSRSILTAIFVIGLLAVGVPSGKAHGDPARVMLLPNELEWIANPTLHDLQTATLMGDPNAAGPYVQRIRIPAHFKIAPHTHPEVRMVTVLAGTLYYAFGDQFDETRLKALPAGSFFIESQDVPHYAMTRGEGVVLQLNANGPSGTTYVDGRH